MKRLTDSFPESDAVLMVVGATLPQTRLPGHSDVRRGMGATQDIRPEWHADQS
jgi:hypothetical protein